MRRSLGAFGAADLRGVAIWPVPGELRTGAMSIFAKMRGRAVRGGAGGDCR
ncbi:hypothetical protein [Pseudotabrizicola alkalilacus]|uniref:hypothetical protein n=1 Tax=Pseudotabrizicola alkalilacus TaxID=2305252 RepID=UPI00131429A8|nr:hypothetical protein [Pseudotabrizicola alkalilacus]